MTDRHVRIIGNIRYKQIVSPDGKSLFMASAGPEGDVIAWDENDIPAEHMAILVLWATEEKERNKPKVPHLDFNPQGFVR